MNTGIHFCTDLSRESDGTAHDIYFENPSLVYWHLQLCDKLCMIDKSQYPGILLSIDVLYISTLHAL